MVGHQKEQLRKDGKPGQFKKPKKPEKKKYTGPKYEKPIRQRDLAPTSSGAEMNYRDRMVMYQLQREQEGLKPLKRRRREADTYGLAPTEVIRAKDADEFNTEKREGESMEKFENRLRMERLRKEKALRSAFVKQSSEAKQEYRREKRRLKSEKKAHLASEAEKDRRYDGSVEKIAFGERVDRPPSFDDIVLPGDHKGNQLDAGKLSNLEKLQRALTNMEKDTKRKTRMDAAEDQAAAAEQVDDNDPMVQMMRAQEKKMKEQQREKQLKEARERQRAVEVEKARLQAQLAYQQMKTKRGNSANLSSLQGIGSQLGRASSQASKDLQSVDGGVFHMGRK